MFGAQGENIKPFLNFLSLTTIEQCDIEAYWIHKTEIITVVSYIISVMNSIVQYVIMIILDHQLIYV